MVVKAAICYLTQNTPIRKTYLKTSLYFLFKYFNEKYRYPIIIFHEGDYDITSQREILFGIRKSCRDLLVFRTISPDDFKVPTHIDKEKLQSILNIDPSPTPYWRDIKYRLMCRWWLMHFMDYVKEYEYVMRLDDDSFIEEHINADFFESMKTKDLDYLSNFIHYDCGICCYGMKNFFEKEFLDKGSEIEDIFNYSEIKNVSESIKKLFSITQDAFDKKIWFPTMYYNNFFVTRTSFWITSEMKAILEKIDKNGSIFYYRWGDSPIQTILLMLMSKPEKITKASFAYSKRIQREAFIGNDKNFYSYMPDQYYKNSCLTNK